MNFRFHTLAALRILTGQIKVGIKGLADVHAYIDEFFDIATGTVNETVTPMVCLSLANTK